MNHIAMRVKKKRTKKSIKSNVANESVWLNLEVRLVKKARSIDKCQLMLAQQTLIFLLMK